MDLLSHSSESSGRQGLTAVNLIFDLALDGPAYPGPLATSDAYAGSVWLGPLGLLSVLETHLGLGGRFASPLKRAAHLVSKLQQHPDHDTAFWSRAFTLDPLATARRLLHDRDVLALWGWQGQGLSPRLQALASATSEALPAIAERLHAVVTAVSGGNKPPIDRLVTYTPPDRLPSLWRALFTALQSAGVRIEPANLPPAKAEGDLSCSQLPHFAPQGDGRLCLLRPHGPLEAADEVAAALASAAEANDLDGVVIVGADTVLEQALARHGLPRVGAGASTPASARLLPLIVEAAFHPMEMGHLHALLVAEPSPIPRKAAHLLVIALQQTPSRKSAAWNKAFAQLATGDDEKRRRRNRSH